MDYKETGESELGCTRLVRRQEVEEFERKTLTLWDGGIPVGSMQDSYCTYR